jgi:tRNA (cmo5U34)-methyltransferase
MKWAKHGYNVLAPVYDSLARLLLGKSIQQMQLQFLNLLISKNKLLILGGGTGWILPAIDRINSNIQIDYVDLSTGMIKKAKERGTDPTRIRFIEGTERDIPNADYDCVITNFYLDLFTDSELKGIVIHIKNCMHPNSYWFVTEFVTSSSWSKVKLKCMYIFFWLTTGLKTTQLPDWNQVMCSTGAKILHEKSSKRGFIKSVIYQL